jgi:hypothetical protein
MEINMKINLSKLFGAVALASTLAGGLLTGGVAHAQSANPMDEVLVQSTKMTLSALHAQCDASSDQKACIKQTLIQATNQSMPSAGADKVAQNFESCVVNSSVDAALGTYKNLFNDPHPSDAEFLTSVHEIAAATDPIVSNCIDSTGFKFGN